MLIYTFGGFLYGDLYVLFWLIHKRIVIIITHCFDFLWRVPVDFSSAYWQLNKTHRCDGSVSGVSLCYWLWRMVCKQRTIDHNKAFIKGWRRRETDRAEEYREMYHIIKRKLCYCTTSTSANIITGIDYICFKKLFFIKSVNSIFVFYG